jgi:hypothetical protein
VILERLKDSPIEKLELFYQRRAQKLKRRGYLIYGVLAALGALFFWLGMWVFIGFSYWTPNSIKVLQLAFYILLTLFHFYLMFRTLQLSSNAIAREKRDPERWEALLMTGISGREIVLGKWWATMRTMWKHYLFLAFLRIGHLMAIVFIGHNLIPRFFPDYFRLVDITVLHILLGFVFVASFTLVNLSYTAACGVMSSIETKRGGTLFRGFAVRTAFLILVAIIPILFWMMVGYGVFVQQGWVDFRQANEIGTLISRFSTAMLDNGDTFSRYILFDSTWLQTNSVGGLFALFFAAMGIYGVLTWGLLRVAQWRAERLGALHTLEAKGEAG